MKVHSNRIYFVCLEGDKQIYVARRIRVCLSHQ